MAVTSNRTLLRVLLCTWLCSRLTHALKETSRIVGGQTTTIAQAPFLVNLRYQGYFYCGGSLVSTTHVVTAGHCVKGKKRSLITVHGGSTKLTQTGVSRTVSKAFLPNRYTSAEKGFDVAVLKLSSAMTGSNIGTIGLCNTNLGVGKKFRIYGWGLTKENGVAVSNIVRTVTVPIVSKRKCAREYRGQSALTKTMVCAGAQGKDSCSGDSGGPAVLNNRLCGIVSFGVGCARANYPGVYTKVAAMRSFINAALKK